MPSKLSIPTDRSDVTIRIGRHSVELTNLDKIFWPEVGLTKRDLLQYYADVAPVLLPHLRNRAMVMKRYPDGAQGEHFFMKHAPSPRPTWIKTCSIEHRAENIVDFPMVQDLTSLLWIVNLGCIDLNPWYSRCDEVNRPDYLHFDLDPVEGTPFNRVVEVALIVREALTQLDMPSYAKTTGATGIHIYVPIVRGPLQKEVWTFAKRFALSVARQHPKIITVEYSVAERPKGHVLVDYNQNSWGKTLASLYSVRPTPRATVSAPLTWEELEHGVTVEQFHLKNMPARIREVGDLWASILHRRGRVRLDEYLQSGGGKSKTRSAKKTSKRTPHG
jgi:bifunctional non-homologous end joining protein LigD